MRLTPGSLAILFATSIAPAQAPATLTVIVDGNPRPVTTASIAQVPRDSARTLSELDPSLGGKRVLLADRVDWKPLPADEAPWRLIIPGDQRPARSARQVVTIRVIAESR